MLKGLNDFLDKHEGRKIGSSTKAILEERKRQGYDKPKAKSKALMGMKKGGMSTSQRNKYNKERDAFWS